VRALAPRAGYCVAVGSCAAYGGIPAGDPGATDAVGLQYEASSPGGALGRDFRARSGLPVINIAGCAPHPGWIMETLASLALCDLKALSLDPLGRPKFFADHLAHHGCARNEYYEYKASAESVSQLGCLMEHLGCKATQAVGDCNQRVWSGGRSCTGAGYPCIACTSPGFESARDFLQTQKLAGIPVGLPLDMPKAWFVALAALSKSATPKRVRRNALGDHIRLPPRRGAE
jgi:ferredoxin hydrogenase small subunit